MCERKTQYVAGFAIAHDRYFPVVKKRDTAHWHAGKWNIPGGKIEEGETPQQAMARELYEETGVLTDADDWKLCLVLSFSQGDDCFLVAHTREYETEVYQKTDELVGKLMVDDPRLTDHASVAHNLQWILPLCLDEEVNKPVVMSVG